MSGSWLSIDERMKRGFEILDKIENSKLRLLVNRICQSLQSGVSKNIFNTEEEEKLLVSLNLEKVDLTILLQTITSVYSQASFHLVKSAALENTMKEHCSIGKDKVAILEHAWITHSEGIVNAFKRQSIFPTQVTDISWSVDVKAASTATAKEAKPIAKLQLNLGGLENSRVTVEMNKTDLWNLFHKLDDIQSQLESLKWVPSSILL
ncbi:PREDICTED: COMM domain-containing protein 1-like [Ceratosolen solmsi marchali]|uniref:COMM domain-containing protein 1-like n=1 Tax=Ceratosolen solmsi marchali TaxID=326594 RepID=A0AAJ6YBP7_9HYME|nr:PREDICTED: COMM domain-containing protein 1-like [Ceratosolen solmsi marchali]